MGLGGLVRFVMESGTQGTAPVDVERRDPVRS